MYSLEFMRELHKIKDFRIRKRIKKIVCGIQFNTYSPDILMSLNNNGHIMREFPTSLKNADSYGQKKLYKIIDSILTHSHYVDIVIIFQIVNGKYTFLSIYLKCSSNIFIADKKTSFFMNERYHEMKMFLYELKLRDVYRLNLNYLRKLSNYCWTPIRQVKISVKEKSDINNIDKNKLNKRFMNILCCNNKLILNKNLNILINNLDPNYRPQAILLKNIINISSSYFTLSFYVLFPILEHILYKRFEKSSRKYLNKEKIISYINRMKKHKLLIRKNMRKFYEFKVISKLYGNGQHTKGKADISYNRDTLVHGKLKISELTKLRALQLILLCCNVSSDFRKKQ